MEEQKQESKSPKGAPLKMAGVRLLNKNPRVEVLSAEASEDTPNGPRKVAVKFLVTPEVMTTISDEQAALFRQKPGNLKKLRKMAEAAKRADAGESDDDEN